MTRLTVPLLVLASLATAPAGASRPAASADRPGSAAVRQAMAIANMSVEIWPEYDDPRVLVIYSGDVARDVTLPADFSFIIPAGAQVHMAGGLNANGEHIHSLYQTRERDDGLVEVTYRLEVPNFYMEFYYDPFTGGDERNFSYPLLSRFDIAALMVSVQRPRRAEGFTVSPTALQSVQDNNGFTYDVLRFDSLPAGTARSVSVVYRKADREPSVTPQQAGGATTADRRTMKSILLFVAILLAGIIAWALFIGPRRRATAGHDDRIRRPARRAQPPGETRYCTQCGQAVSAEDRFCGMCGQPVRAPELAATSS